MNSVVRSQVRGLGVVLAVLMLSACGDAQPDPQDQAISTCQQMAVTQYDLQDAGDDVEVSKLSVENGEGFTVLGTSDDIKWTCTWTLTQTGQTTESESTIDRR